MPRPSGHREGNTNAFSAFGRSRNHSGNLGSNHGITTRIYEIRGVPSRSFPRTPFLKSTDFTKLFPAILIFIISDIMRYSVLGRAVWILPLALIDVARSASCLPAYNATITYVGCYVDPLTPRDLAGPMLTVGNSNSPQYCADVCGAAGYSYSGVEFAM